MNNIKIKITFCEQSCEIEKNLDLDKPELEQIVEAFENALKGCGFDLNGKELEFKDTLWNSGKNGKIKKN